MALATPSIIVHYHKLKYPLVSIFWGILTISLYDFSWLFCSFASPPPHKETSSNAVSRTNMKNVTANKLSLYHRTTTERECLANHLIC